MSFDEFRDDLLMLLGRYPSLSADEIRDASEVLEKVANRRESERELL